MSDKKFSLTSSDFGVKGWIFIVYSALVFFLPPCITGIYQVGVSLWGPAYGWDATLLYSMVSVGGILTVAAAFLCGKLAVHVSPKKLSLITGAGFLACVGLMGFVTEQWMMLLIICLVGPMGSTWCYNLNPIILANWFPRKKGLVMGWATIGIPFGAGVTNKLFLWAVNSFGLKYAFIPYFLLGLVAYLTLAFWVKDNPEEAGYNPDNDKSMTAEEAKAFLEKGRRDAANSAWTTKRVVSTKEVWILALAMGVQQLFAGGVMAQMIPRLMELNYDQASSINLLLFAALCACVGSYLMGLLDAKVGPRRAIQYTYVMSMLAMVLNLAAGVLTGFISQVFVYVSLILAGVTIGGAANFSASICISYWGRFNFACAYGIVQPIIQIIGAFASVYMAQVAAHFGGYSASYVGLIILNIIGLLVFNTIKDGSFVQRREAEFAAEDAKV